MGPAQVPRYPLLFAQLEQAYDSDSASFGFQAHPTCQGKSFHCEVDICPLDPLESTWHGEHTSDNCGGTVCSVRSFSRATRIPHSSVRRLDRINKLITVPRSQVGMGL